MDCHGVIHVSVGLHLGGLEKSLVEFARHADPKRFDLRFISLTTKGHAAEQIEKIGWPVTALNQPPGVNVATSFQLAQLFRRSRPRIVHTHNTKPLLYAVPAAHLVGVPTIIHTRHGQRHGATSRQNFLFNLAARWADQIVSVSNDSAALALRQGLPSEKMVTIHNGIDPSLFPLAGPHPTGPAVFVGRLSPEKDLPTLLRAVASLEEPSFRLDLVGDGPCFPELHHLAAQLGIAQRVKFLGPSEHVSATLRQASLFVLPSVTEGISLALLEAMASGLPVVATAVGGNTEVVIHGETGLLVPPRSPEALAEAMLTLHRQPELARRMGLAGRQRVEAHFDSRRMVAQYESLYLSAQPSLAAA